MNAAEVVRPARKGRIMVWQDGEPVEVAMTWGLEPIADERPVTLLRWEGREIINPCLIVANDFSLTKNGTTKYRASLITSNPCFFLAGMWRRGEDGWPDAYAALTTEAYPDLAPYKDRHIAVIREEHWIDWLSQSRPVTEMMKPFPLGSFAVNGPSGRVERAPTSSVIKASTPAMGDLFG